METYIIHGTFEISEKTGKNGMPRFLVFTFPLGAAVGAAPRTAAPSIDESQRGDPLYVALWLRENHGSKSYGCSKRSLRSFMVFPHEIRHEITKSSSQGPADDTEWLPQCDVLVPRWNIRRFSAKTVFFHGENCVFFMNFTCLGFWKSADTLPVGDLSPLKVVRLEAHRQAGVFPQFPAQFAALFVGCASEILGVYGLSSCNQL